PARAARAPARRRGPLAGHHEPGSALHPRARRARLPGPGPRRRRRGHHGGCRRRCPAGATWEDELVAIPFWANTQLLWYRQSVADEVGLDMSQPVTWDQLMEAAEDSDKFLGIHGIRGESMTVWINALYESQGQA